MIRGEPREFLLGIVTASTAVAGSPYVWRYSVKPAAADLSTKTVAAKANATSTVTAYSISELGNNNGSYSYGVPPADLFGTFVPVKIPDGTPVICIGMRDIAGTFFWCIINSQAITGNC